MAPRAFELALWPNVLMWACDARLCRAGLAFASIGWMHRVRWPAVYICYVMPAPEFLRALGAIVTDLA